MTPKKSAAKKTSDASRTQSLAVRVTAAPKVVSPETARGLLKRDIGAALERFEPIFAENPCVRALIEGIAEGSPYLWDLIRADPARCLTLLTADPERHFPSLLARSFAAVDAAGDEADAM